MSHLLKEVRVSTIVTTGVKLKFVPVNAASVPTSLEVGVNDVIDGDVAKEVEPNPLIIIIINN